MALIQTRLPLFSDAFYSFTTSLEEDTYTISILYVKRINDWVISIKDAARNTLVEGQRFTPDTPLFADCQLPGLSGFFWLTTKSGEDPSKFEDRRRNLPEYFNFYYIYEDGE